MRKEMKELQKAPGKLPEGTVFPQSIDFGETPADWQKRRKVILDRWLNVLGSFPEKCDLKPEVIEEKECSKYIRRKVRYQVERIKDGIWTEAYLLIPKTVRQLFPGVIVFHPTTKENILEPAGLAGFPSRHNGLHLVERGYVVLCPRNYLWDYRGDTSAKMAEIARLVLDDHPGWTGMTKMIWDGIRSVDYLETLDFVDKKRIGCFGFSLGGKEALYVPAFDERLKVSVSIEGGIGLSYSNWYDPWYLGKKILDVEFKMENHEILSLIAPRAFLLMGSMGGVREDDRKYVNGCDGERSWPFIEAVLPVYKMLNAREHIGILCYPNGHSIPRVARETAYQWLDSFLKSNHV